MLKHTLSSLSRTSTHTSLSHITFNSLRTLTHTKKIFSSLNNNHSIRYFSTEENKPTIDAVSGDQEAKILAERIAKLDLVGLVEVMKQLQIKLGVPEHMAGMAGAMGGMNMGMGMQMGGAAPQAQQAQQQQQTPAPDAAAAKPAGGAQTEFTVRLVKLGDNAKYKVIKELREVKPTLSLMDTKQLTEKLPSVISEKLSKADAEAIAAKLKAAGGECEVV
eukprot:TRINITY_DN8864_c0_g1_i3.p1 TRINITY_DN8864_c0_g1~~TRINITY_DN8864_c0_g1_i3.p1  ORF type:complete len:219 (+),score=57.98 TRINITY_DN8864_c0_g1_i3:134-790(+)